MSQHQPSILVVDDEAHVRTLLQAVMTREGWSVDCAEDGQHALQRFSETQPDIVLMDIRMPRLGGLEALQQMRALRHDANIILMTAYAAVDTAVQAMRLGAFDYIIKPFDIDEVKLLVGRALQMRQMKEEIKLLHRELSDAWRLDRILTNDPGMLALCSTIERIAPTQASVLITGESGTGKELIARAIHYNSPRNQGPFIKINCGALPEGLLESELFGHEKGAFTGAHARRRGRFEQASGGTLFLDEIGEVSPALQVKLLRVLQEREFERIGGEETLKTDIRVLAATNRDIEAMVQAGTFRADLYYRLNVVRLNAPPLRERPNDVALLAEHFLYKFATDNHREISGLDQSALTALRQYPWPGNIRELANAIERAVIMCTGTMIFIEDLPEPIQHSEAEESSTSLPRQRSDLPLKDKLKHYEAQLIREALTQHQGNRVKTAQELGVCRRTLMYKLQEYDIE